jgi:glycine/D-amino acid oxidase-like deaminating enzyme
VHRPPGRAASETELEAGYRARSLWLDQLEGPLTPRAALSGDIDCDVAIVGAGFTGLWTAYYLKVRQPDLRVVVLEREIAGFGPSGRNGGWVTGGLAGSASAYGIAGDPQRRRRALRATFDAVDEVGAVAAREEIDCGFRKAGALSLAMTAPQWQRLRARETESAAAGADERDGRLLSPVQAEALVSVPGLLGGWFTPHAARVDPARLVRGLAVACERHGVSVLERTTATALEAGRVRCTQGTVRA